MIVCIVLTAVIACLVTALIFTIKANLRLQKEIEHTNHQLYHTNAELTHLQAMYIEAVQTNAWLRGLHIGHEPRRTNPKDPRTTRGVKETYSAHE